MEDQGQRLLSLRTDMISAHLKDKLALLKPLPGCYLMKDKEGRVIYVGKAKKLDKRVNSYFNRPHEGKTARLVQEIVTFDTIITSTEKEALLLEINLIHTYNPPFNILLKDGKSYPYIQIKGKDYPYLAIARNIKDKKARFYGPYPEGKAARSTINLLNRIFPLRKCQTLPKRACLYYHLGQCYGPCINKIEPKIYQDIVHQIDSFMKGNTADIRQEIQAKMLEASSKLNFEQAQEYKEIIEGIDHISSHQKIQTNTKIDKDVIAFHFKDGNLAISILCYRDGFLKIKHNDVVSSYGDIENELITYLLQYYETTLKPKLLIMPKIADSKLLEEILDVKIITPSQGDNFALLQMAAQNAIEGMEEKYLSSKIADDEYLNLLENLASLAHIPTPYQIELIDNSHLQGAEAVSAVVVFLNGKPLKKMYRKYRLNSEEKRDDIASMKEVLYRRYYRLISENGKLSDLLIVDGGYNQLKAAKEIIDTLGIDLPVLGLVKDNHHSTEALILEDGTRVDIKGNKDLFFLLTKMQDEVHRFVITYHRDKRSKAMFNSPLDDIKGLGSVRKEALIKAFGSVDKIFIAPIEELLQYVPKKVALAIKEKHIG